jgi:hypothetical protein
MGIQRKNNVSTTLAAAISASDVGMTVATGTGAQFPTLGATDYFYATLETSQGTQEIVKVTARSGDNMTIVRAQDGSTANSFGIGARVSMQINVATITTYDPAGTGAVTTTVQTKLRESVSVKDFGAVGDGVIDDSVAFQNAINAASSGNQGVFLPSGKYRLTEPIEIPNSVYIEGVGCQVTTASTPNTASIGSWIYIDHTGQGLYFRDDALVGTTKKFSKLSQLGFYRNQPTPAAAWTPTANEHDIRIEYNVELNDVMFLNSTKAVLIRSAGQLRANNVRGQVFDVGFECERSSDVQNWTNIHWWPYWSQQADVTDYTITNAIGFKLQRADGLNIINPFGIFQHRLVKIQDLDGFGSGVAGFNIIDGYSDRGGGGIEIHCDFYASYGNIVNYLHNCDIDNRGSGAGISISGVVSTNINITNYRSNRSYSEALVVSGASHNVKITPSFYNGWDFAVSGTTYCFSADDGAIIEFLAIPRFSASNSRQFTENTNGIIRLPVKYRLNSAAIAPAYLSYRNTLATDEVAVIPSPSSKVAIMMIVPGNTPANGFPAGTYWLSATATPTSTTIAATTSTNVVVTTGILTGTTGVAGDLTISAGNDGNFYLENRTAVTRAYNIVLFGI